MSVRIDEYHCLMERGQEEGPTKCALGGICKLDLGEACDVYEEALKNGECDWKPMMEEHLQKEWEAKMFKNNSMFAPEYSRTPEGWVNFPSDAAYRKEMFPATVSGHIAKANVYLVQAIIEFVSKPGDYLLDPFGGTGTLMVAALAGRDVMLIEISPKYHEWQKEALASMEKIAPGISSHVSLVNMPLQNILPIPDLANHIIFSPPYASMMKTKGKDKLTRETMGEDAGEYTYSHPLNLGTMGDWLWAQELKKVYTKCYNTLKPGGTMTVIVKDHYEKQKDETRKRIPLSRAAWDSCISIGFLPHSWLKWKAPGSVYTGIYRSRGWEVVDDEDILVVQKPSNHH